MIVNQQLSGWEIISHYTHGLLAGKIAMQLASVLRPDHWEDILTAIIEHDDHLLDFNEKNYLTEVGSPLDFTLDERSEKDAHAHAVRVYGNSCQKSQMVALLVGRHLEFLYGSKENSDFIEFFKTLKKERINQLKLYGWNTAKLEKAYALMRFCDRCSLIICQKLIPAGNRKLEINKSINAKTYYINGEENLACIDPWPFEQNAFTLNYEYRLLKQPSFSSNKQLERAIENSPVSVHEIIINKKKIKS